MEKIPPKENWFGLNRSTANGPLSTADGNYW
jgi:hypothetical protein